MEEGLFFPQTHVDLQKIKGTEWYKVGPGSIYIKKRKLIIFR